MILEDGHRCLLCGSQNPIGLKLDIHWDDGRAWADVRIPADYQGWNGVAHGGIVSALLDEAMFYALHSLGWSGVTAELSVRFLLPAPLEADLRLEAEVETRRGRFGKATAWLRQGGRTLAEARGKFLAPAASLRGGR